MPVISRQLLFILTAVLFNVLLFLLIQKMVTEDAFRAEPREPVNLLDFIRLKPEAQRLDEKKVKEEKPEEPPPPEATPPPPELPAAQVDKAIQPSVDLPRPDIDLPLSVEGVPYLGDFLKPAAPPPPAKKEIVRQEVLSNIAPTYKTKPTYPPRALRSGIEGVVTVEFIIDVDGKVKDPVIVDANPPDIFDKEVLKTIVKWKFNPTVIDGNPVEQRARQDIHFRLSN